jgi:serine/threonine-protein kinase RsbW
MPTEPGLPAPGESGSAHCLQLVIPADTLAVRNALIRMCDALILRSLPEDERGTVEIVLAEVLNNIVEHAYSADEGEIEITLRRAPDGLLCQIVDHGARMPDERLPEGDLPPMSADNLPEGGFGWHLIRSLSQELVYSRGNGQNRLTFRLGIAPLSGQSA